VPNVDMTERRSSLPWLELSLIAGLTGAAWRRLAQRFGGPQAILSQTTAALASVVDENLARAITDGADRAQLEQALAWQQSGPRLILTPDDPRYPPLLLQSAAAPFVLYAEGRLDLLQSPALAIVGSRNATPQGLRNAQTFARSIAASGVTIVSGLALGIDAAAHEAALDQPGSTIAVLGSGADVVYPKRNAGLFEQVRSRGLILSEFPLGTAPVAAHFPRRNRIISGLAQGCLVVEAAMASGSLITARLSVEMGRDVFAIPGSIHSPLSKGCHYLIKQGAKLVETAEDVLEEFGLTGPATARPNVDRARPSTPDARLLDRLGHEPCDLDAILDGLGAEVVLPILTQWELEGLVARLPDGSYQRLQ
jgi:DNA processing protein